MPCSFAFFLYCSILLGELQGRNKKILGENKEDAKIYPNKWILGLAFYFLCAIMTIDRNIHF